MVEKPRELARKPIIQSWKESQTEAKIVREVLCVAQTENENDGLELVLENGELRRTLRITSWMLRFVHNCINLEKRAGPLTSAEIE